MRIYPGTTVDYEFATLGGLGYAGSLNDRQFAKLRADGKTGSLTDMFSQDTVDLGLAVQARLSGTTGFASNPIAANLFQDTAGATPVTAISDPVGRFNCQWGSAPPNWQQGVALQRPVWDGTGLTYDGVNSYFSVFSNMSFLNNVPGVFYCESFSSSSLAALRVLNSFSTGASATIPRFLVYVDTDGSIKVQSRRLDADATNVTTTAAGVITAGVSALISCQVDWAGTGLAKVWVDGTEVISSAVTGSVANTSATDSLRVRDGSALNSAPGSPFIGWTRRSVFAPYILNDTDRATIEAWAGAV